MIVHCSTGNARGKVRNWCGGLGGSGVEIRWPILVFPGDANWAVVLDTDKSKSQYPWNWGGIVPSGKRQRATGFHTRCIAGKGYCRIGMGSSFVRRHAECLTNSPVLSYEINSGINEIQTDHGVWNDINYSYRYQKSHPPLPLRSCFTALLFIFSDFLRSFSAFTSPSTFFFCVVEVCLTMLLDAALSTSAWSWTNEEDLGWPIDGNTRSRDITFCKHSSMFWACERCTVEVNRIEWVDAT